MSDIEVKCDIEYVPQQHIPKRWPIGMDRKLFFAFEKYMAQILHGVFGINMKTDGHIMYWALGIYITYLESAKYKNKWQDVWSVMSTIVALKVALDEGDNISQTEVRRIMDSYYHQVPLHVFTNMELVLIEVCDYRLYRTLERYLPRRFSFKHLELIDHREDHVKMARRIVTDIVCNILNFNDIC